MTTVGMSPTLVVQKETKEKRGWSSTEVMLLDFGLIGTSEPYWESNEDPIEFTKSTSMHSDNPLVS